MALSLILALVAFSSCNNESTSSSEPESIPEQSVEESTEPESLSLNIGSYNIAHGQFINYDMQPIADDILEKDHSDHSMLYSKATLITKSEG